MLHDTGLSNVPSSNNGSVELQPPQPPPQAHCTIVQPIPTQAPQNTAHMSSPDVVVQAPSHAEVREQFEASPELVLVIVTLIASITYTVGLNPPGGFWQDDINGHEAGNAILHSKSPYRYTIFFYANGIAFMASWLAIIILTDRRFFFRKSKVKLLENTLALGLVCLVVSYAAGCARRISTSIYVIVFAALLLLFVYLAKAALLCIRCWVARLAPPYLGDRFR